ncbi:MAG: septum formation protein Maf [Candidatus Aenigmarchaeota archaeon]|nr:septum formation protein Maf [Candidatus Aenigmarchaeota archaeon]
MKIILASQSPRRKKLLKKISPFFEVIVSNFDEEKIKSKSPIEFVKLAAQSKARATAQKINYPAFIISADTVVAFREKIIGKPKDDVDAFRILSTLNGQEQIVLSGFCLLNTLTKQEVVDVEQSIVKMKQVSVEEIRRYIATGEGADKAGAYAIQGKTDKFIDYFEGSYDNIVGLPTEKIIDTIQRFFLEMSKEYNFNHTK